VPTPKPSRKLTTPRYRARLRELWLRGRRIYKFSRPAPDLELLLSVFEEDHWAQRVLNPFGGPAHQAHESLHNAVTRLNRRIKQIRFHLDGTGKGVLWQLA